MNASPSTRRGRGAVAALGLGALIASVMMAAPVANATSTEPSLSPTADTSVWGTNGRVMDILSLGDKAVLAGGFDYVGPTVGHAARVSPDTGAMLGSRQMFTDNVYVTIPDGAGGWFAGGEFGAVDGAYRRSIVHIGADGAVDKTFNASANGKVQALALVEGKLIVGGKFTKAGGVTVANIVALDPSTGLAVPGWSASANNTVYALEAVGSQVYVGGQFTNLNGSSRRYLGRISAATGGYDSSFSGQTSGIVRSIDVDPSSTAVYVGGDFTSASSRYVGSTGRNRLAAFSTTAGDIAAWNPNAGASVRVLEVAPTGSSVYVGGEFTTIAGQSRTAFAEVTINGEVTGRDLGIAKARCPHTTKSAYSLPTKGCDNTVAALDLSDGKLLVGGQFSEVLGTPRHHVAEVDIATNQLSDFNPVAGNFVNAVLHLGDENVIAGDFTSVGGLIRDGLAVIDLTTGEADPGFTADVDLMVNDVALSPNGQYIYAGGDFKSVNGVARSKVVKLDVNTGAVDPKFKAGINNIVIKIGVDGDKVYLGGKFTKIGSQKRLHTARLEEGTGNVDLGWTADTTGPSGKLRGGGMVQGLEVAPDGSKVYLSGPFNTLNGTSLPGGIAVVSGTDGTIDPRVPGGVAGCAGVGPWINRIYLSPDGLRLYGGDVCPDNIYQWDAVNLTTTQHPNALVWRTWCNAGMQGSLEVNGRFYYGSHGGDKGSGGRCSAYPGGPSVDRQRFVVFDAETGNLLSFAPEFNTPMGVWSFADNPRGLLVGGDFTLAGDRNTVTQGFALFRGTP